MRLDDRGSELLKTWVIKRLSDVSDADPDVLGEYVLALVKSDEPDAVVRSTCISNLQDFLQDSTESFVDEVIAVIATNSYDPDYVPIATAPAVPTGFDSRKRGHEDDGMDNSNARFGSGDDRPAKQLRRGRGGPHGARGGRFQQTPQQQWQPASQIPQVPALPQGIPPFDVNNPLATFLAMQQLIGLPALPGMPQAPSAHTQIKSGRRCYDYDAKGFCAKGASCMYEHGDDAIMLPPNEPYDPTNSTLVQFPTVPDLQHRDNTPMRGRGRGRGIGSGHRGGNRRAEISHLGQNYDTANTTIVVESIPEAYFDEKTVRDFFGQFGHIEEVQMHAYKRLAIVKYDQYDAAKAAYDSPKVVFDNRFVKVYWHKMDGQTEGGTVRQNGPTQKNDLDAEMKVPEPSVDLEAIAIKQAEAQKKHEENMKQRAAAEQKKHELDAQLKAMDEEKHRLAAKLAKKTGKHTDTTNANMEQENRTKDLKDKLARLEAEAQELGIDPHVPSNDWSPYPSRGRGGYRGRGAPRGRGYNPGYAGTRGGAVKRLDNRPRTISMIFPEGTFDQHAEALRQYLLLSNHLDFANLSRHPDRADTALIAFDQRYRAENFMAAAASGLPHVGQVVLAWQANAPAAATAAAANGNASLENASQIDTSESPALGESAPAFDVADEDDRWT